MRPDPYHPPGIQQDDPDGHGVEHGLCREAVAFLHVPEAEDAHGLGGDADDEQVGQVEGVVGHDRVLQGSDHGDGRV